MPRAAYGYHLKTTLACFALALAACTAPNKGTTPTVPESIEQLAENATYKIITPGRSQCTGWVVDDAGHLITAGHCCATPGTYTLVAKSGRSVTATAIAWEDDDDDMTDVCLLKANGAVNPPLPLADQMPSVGDEVGFVGYPKGVWTHSTGEFVGDIDGPGSNWNDYVSDAPCNKGASGSGMYSAAGAYGVLVRLVVVGDQVLPGEYGCVASPLSQILSILTHR